MNIGKWIDEESVTMFFCPSVGTMKLCFKGQFLHEAVTEDLPAAPMGQVFWIRRAKARRNMMEHSLGFIVSQYMNLLRESQPLFRDKNSAPYPGKDERRDNDQHPGDHGHD